MDKVNDLASKAFNSYNRNGSSSISIEIDNLKNENNEPNIKDNKQNHLLDIENDILKDGNNNEIVIIVINELMN